MQKSNQNSNYSTFLKPNKRQDGQGSNKGN